MDADRGPVGLKIDTLKQMHLETVLAADGEPGGKIVIGENPEHQRQAQRKSSNVFNGGHWRPSAGRLRRQM